MRAVEKRTATEAERKLAEREQVHQLWKRYRAERIGELLKGPYAKAAHELIVFLGTMKLADEAALIDLVNRGPWRTAEADTKFEVLALINAALTTKRERAGLPPFDDGIPPDEEPTAFIVIREMFR